MFLKLAVTTPTPDQPPPLPQELPAEQPIEVRLSTTKAVWFDMVFMVGTQGRIVEVSDVFFDRPDVWDWMADIANGVPYTRTDVDLEGSIDTMECYGIDDLRVRLIIRDEESAHPYVDAVVSRRKLLWELYAEFQAHAGAICQRSRYYKDYAPDGAKALFRSDVVEHAINWPQTHNTLTITDDVTGLERADPLDIEEIRSRP